MAKELKVYRIEDFIKLTESGEIDSEKTMAIVRELAGVAKSHSHCNILIDGRETTVPERSFSEAMQLVTDIVHYRPELPNRLATLVPDNPMRLHSAHLIEACLQLQGFKYKVFTEYEPAIEWLADTTDLS